MSRWLTRIIDSKMPASHNQLPAIFRLYTVKSKDIAPAIINLQTQTRSKLPVLIVAFVYLMELVETYKYWITPNTLEACLTTAVILSSKFVEDDYIPTGWYSKIVPNIYNLEVWLCKLRAFDFFVPLAQFTKTKAQLMSATGKKRKRALLPPPQIYKKNKITI